MVMWLHCRQLMYGYPSVLRFVQVLSCRLCWQLSALFNVTRRGKPSWPRRCTCKRCVIVSTTIFKIENIIPIIRDGHDGPSLPTSFPPCLRYVVLCCRYVVLCCRYIVSCCRYIVSCCRYVVSCCRDVRRRRVVPSLCRVVSLWRGHAVVGSGGAVMRSGCVVVEWYVTVDERWWCDVMWCVPIPIPV